MEKAFLVCLVNVQREDDLCYSFIAFCVEINHACRILVTGLDFTEVLHNTVLNVILLLVA